MKHLIISAIAAVALLTTATTMLWSYSPSTERHAAGTVIDHCKNFHSLAGTKASEPFALLSANSRQKGAAIFFRTWFP